MHQSFDNVIQHFEKDLAVIQAGRVSPSLIEDVIIEAYNTTTPLQQLATITNQGVSTLIIQPWDPSILKDIEKGLRRAPGDFNPVVDSTTIRLPFPPLTEEKRKQLVKIVHEHREQARIMLRKVREELMQELKTKKTDGTISEDQFFSEQKQLQKSVDDYNKKIESITERKEAVLLQV